VPSRAAAIGKSGSASIRRPATTSGSVPIKRAVLILILAYAAFLRLYRLADLPPGLYRDEAANGTDARRGFAIFYPANNGREGLFIDIQAVSIAAFGNEPWALRLPSAVFGVLTVGGLYLLGAELFGEEAGLLAAFFLATSFWHLNFSRIGLRAISAPCFLVWSLWLLLTGMRRARSLLLVFAAIVYGLGFYTYIAYRITPLLIAIVLYRMRASRRASLLFTATAALTIAPLAIYFALHPAALTEYPERISVLHHSQPAWEVVLNVWRTFRMFFRHGDPNWRHNAAYRAELYWPVAALFAAGVILSVMWRRKFVYAIPLVWLFVAAIPVVLSGDTLPHALRSLLMAPAVFLLAAIAAREAMARVRLPAAAIAVIAVWLAWEPYHTYFEVWAKNPNVAEAFDIEAVQLARRLRQTPGEKTVLVPASNPMLAEPILFLAGESGITYVTADIPAPELTNDRRR
jgi:4-amino-4-deoxy-L-arabinose transferase-like glycosyltransferase